MKFLWANRCGMGYCYLYELSKGRNFPLSISSGSIFRNFITASLIRKEGENYITIGEDYV